MWHLECFVTLGFLTAVTDRVTLETGVVVLPQRPPALVAKEAATVDVLSNGRLRLGIGVGWQAPEYEALGVPFKQRGARIVRGHRGPERDVDGAAYRPQRTLLLPRRRWYGTKASAKPYPPLLMGVGARGVGPSRQLADGWVAGPGTPAARFDTSREAVLRAAREAGREAEVTIFEGSAFPQSPNPSDMLETLRNHKDLGATDMLFWMGTARDPLLRPLLAKLEYVERLVEEVWPQL
jgi:alkanesulfonate monooxygenase SsuD/methylene tetrahydromethanopterin reductase-like flavin-dependent oxidoreductase (luciferase family)